MIPYGYRIKTSINISNWISYGCYFSGILNLLGTTARRYVVVYKYGGSTSNFMLGVGEDYASNTTANLHQWYEIDASTVNGNVYYEVDNSRILSNSATTGNFNLTLYLFSVNWGGGYNRNGAAIVKMKITELYNENNILIGNFIPCYRKSDNKPGLYDTVTTTFFTNANTSASTDFIVGPDV